MLFTGQICSLIGDQFFIVALPFLVLGRARADTLGEVLLAYGAARLVALPLGGILADRFPRRLMMLGSDAGRMILLAALAVVPLRTLWPLFVLVILTGGFEGIFLPPSWALLPELLDEELMGPGNALLTGATMGTTLVGPALAGFLVLATSPHAAFAVDAATFAVSVLTLIWIRPARRTSAEEAASGNEAVPAGADPPPEDVAVPTTFWGLLRTSTFLQFTLAIAVIANLAYDGAGQVALPVFSKDSLHAGVRGYGLLLAALGLGLLVGALVSARLFNLPRRGKVALGLGITQGIAFALVPAGNALWVGVVALAVAGFCNGINNVFYTTMLQQRLPAALLGRCMSALLTSAFGAYPVAVVASGFVITSYGTLPVFLFAGLTVIAAFVLGFFSSEYRSL